MKLSELIEFTRQHFPEMGVTEIVLLLNSVSDDFCNRSKCVRGTYGVDITGDKYYDIARNYVEVKEIAIQEDTDVVVAARELTNPPVKEI